MNRRPPPACVVDTRVLRGANAPLDTRKPKEHSIFARRLSLLDKIKKGKLVILISAKLAGEYSTKIPAPLNDYVKEFFASFDDPTKCEWNWCTPWGGDKKGAVRECRFPFHDVHLLRTAVRSGGSTICTEESALINTDGCIHRRLRVHVRKPEAV